MINFLKDNVKPKKVKMGEKSDGKLWKMRFEILLKSSIFQEKWHDTWVIMYVYISLNLFLWLKSILFKPIFVDKVFS